MAWQSAYLDRFYRGRKGWIDGTTEFHELCASRIRVGSTILEIGAGPTNSTSAFLARLGDNHGLDVDPVVRTNTALRSATVLAGTAYPFPDGSFDACVSDYVVEHLEQPELHLSEVRRVLKPSGVYVFRTPNRHHYVAVVSRHTPYWFHRLVANRVRRLPAEAHEPHPTYYRLNDPRAIRIESDKLGLGVEHLGMIEKEPSYGMGSRLLFLMGLAYERLVNSTDRLSWLRANVFCVLRRSN